MLDLNIAFIQLIWELMNHHTGDLGRVEFRPQKPAFSLNESRTVDLARSTPEKEGVPSGVILSMLRELCSDESAHMHQLMILRHGRVIFETSFDPYVRGVWHHAYSMSKSAAVIAAGILYDEGKLSLSDRVIDFFPEEWTPMNAIRYSGLTVRDLLIMSSGSAFNELGAISGNDWVKGYFSAPLRFTPGTQFDYNSMNTFILSAIISRCTGMDLFSFLKLRAFAPMGICETYWEHSPTGITKGGWGLFIRTEDAAKIGLLFMNGGVYNGHRILSEEFVRMAVTRQIDTGMEYSPGYGCHIWSDSRPGSFMFNGMLGQDVHCYPDLDMVIAVNGGNESIFQESRTSDIIRRHFGDAFAPVPEAGENDPVTADHEKLMALKRRCEGEDAASFPALVRSGGWKRKYRRDAGPDPAAFFRSLQDNVYELQDKGVGIMPLMLQVIHNNYTEGISHIRFRTSGRNVYVDIREGRKTISLPVGFGRGRHTSIDFRGEPYIAGIQGTFGCDEEKRPVLKLRICLLEEACERSIRIVFEDDGGLTLYFDESPGGDMVADTLEKITAGGSRSAIMNGLLAQISPDLIRMAVKTGIRPEVRAEKR